jgi:hypothetical protein
VVKKRDLWCDPEEVALATYWKTSRRDETAAKESKRIDLRMKQGVGPSTFVKWKHSKDEESGGDK